MYVHVPIYLFGNLSQLQIPIQLSSVSNSIYMQQQKIKTQPFALLWVFNLVFYLTKKNIFIHHQIFIKYTIIISWMTQVLGPHIRVYRRAAVPGTRMWRWPREAWVTAMARGVHRQRHPLCARDDEALLPPTILRTTMSRTPLWHRGSSNDDLLRSGGFWAFSDDDLIWSMCYASHDIFMPIHAIFMHSIWGFYDDEYVVSHVALVFLWE